MDQFRAGGFVGEDTVEFLREVEGNLTISGEISCLGDIVNPSCSLQALNSKGQHEPDDLQLKPSRRDRMDLLRKQLGYAAEDRLYVLANRLTQELLPRRHRSLGVLPAL